MRKEDINLPMKSQCNLDCFHCIIEDCVLESTTSQLKYNHSEAGKQSRKKYEQSEKGKLRQKRYEQSEKGKATRKAYEKSDARKESKRKYYESHKEEKREYDRQRYLRRKLQKAG